ncbi:MAG: hypothetical protein JWM96_1078 [Alphaproteobacteria bacterium]|nr:hypothetical protein [Alphaproteobacteria bacterium]
MRNMFDIVVDAPPQMMRRMNDIHSHYFSIDTADLTTFNEWYEFNPLILGHTVFKGESLGYYCILPITSECAELFDQQAIKEEDLTSEHIVPREVMQHAKFAYIAAVAIMDMHDFTSRQCAAAMIAAIASHFTQDYDPQSLQRIYANPTTFDGNHMVHKLGLKPVVTLKKPLRGNDIYALDLDAETLAQFKHFSERYSRFIHQSPWK